MKIEFSGEYTSMYAALVADDDAMRARILEHVIWFRRNTDDTRLANHPLHKKMKGYWAFSVTDDIRIVYRWMGKTTVRFLAIGRHETVYKKSS